MKKEPDSFPLTPAEEDAQRQLERAAVRGEESTK